MLGSGIVGVVVSCVLGARSARLFCAILDLLLIDCCGSPRVAMVWFLLGFVGIVCWVLALGDLFLWADW